MLFRVEGDRSLMVGTKLAPRNAYEMDYNTGATAGIAEMLLQSHQGYLHLLPALPAAWPAGSIAGLHARGGFEVDITWQDGKIASASVHSSLGGACRLRAGVPLIVRKDGQPVAITQVAANIIEFDSFAGCEYAVSGLATP
jgi:alpha-L-fucosidase 2